MPLSIMETSEWTQKSDNSGRGWRCSRSLPEKEGDSIRCEHQWFMCASAIRAREWRTAEREEPSGRWMYRLICQLIHGFCSPACPPSSWSPSEGSVIETDDQIHQHRQLLPLMEGGRPSEVRITHKRINQGCSSCPSCSPKFAFFSLHLLPPRLNGCYNIFSCFEVNRIFLFVL